MQVLKKQWGFTTFEELVSDVYAPTAEEVKEQALFWEEVESGAERGDEACIRILEKRKMYDDVINHPVADSFVSKAAWIAMQYEFFRLDKTNFSLEKYYLNDEGTKINYLRLAEDLAKSYCVVTTRDNTIWIWDGKKFVEGEIKLVKVLQDIFGEKASEHRVHEVMFHLKARTKIDYFPFNRNGKYIPVKNGVLDVNTGELYPHSPLFGFTYCINARYDPNADTSFIEKFFDEVGGENKNLLFEIFGYCLIPGNKYQKAFMFVGDGANGKSTVLSLLKEFLGSDNVSSIALQDFDGNRFAASQLVGKLANICADIPKNPLRYSGKFKMLTGGDTITVERKFRDPVQLVNQAKLIFSANELPEINDQTYAFWRRWILIEFTNKFEGSKKDPEILNKLTTEENLSALLLKALEGLNRLELREQFSVTKSAEKIMEEWMKRANTVYAFVSDMIEQDPSAWVSKEELYNAYRDYCEENDVSPLANNKFAQELKKFIKVRSAQKKVGGTRVRVWEGIRLKVKPEDEDMATIDDFADTYDWSLDEVME